MEMSIPSAYSKNECQKYFDYLERLRQSGETNMYGAVPYLQNAEALPDSSGCTFLSVGAGAESET